MAPRTPKRRGRIARRIALGLFTVVLLLALWPAFLIWDANANLNRTSALSGAANTPGTTWLLAGSDSRDDGAVADGTEGQRADSIMLVNVAPNGQAAMVSIPRDTLVEIPEYGWNKINASYAFGGPELLVQTVEQLSGLTVDHYVEIGMGGVGQIVDAVGGVELCLDMDVNDEFSGLVWTAGCHNADGTTALAFSRMRYSDPEGDIGRARRQRQVVSKVVAKALSAETLTNPWRTLSLERTGASVLVVDEDSSVVDVGRLLLAFRSAQNEGLTGAPPIASLDEWSDAGSGVLLQDTTAPDFFSALRNGELTTDSFHTFE